jgi:hypothetical protein
VTDAAQGLGDLLVADIFAFDQHSVEVEDQTSEFQLRSPKSAVPTRTWVAPMVTAVS